MEVRSATMSYYGEESSTYLKHCFKFYKNIDSNQLIYIDESSRSIMEANWELKQAGTISVFPEGLFLLRNVLSEHILTDLLYQSIADWTNHPSKLSNLDSNNPTELPPNLWLHSSKEIALGKCWGQTPMGKLRWITFGYHYQWSERRYDESKRGEFPPLLAKVSTQLVDILRNELSLHSLNGDFADLSQACTNYRPEAAIVNYYRGKTTMGFHTDEVEFDKKAPLVSISLGPSAVYLWEVSKPITAHPTFLHSPSNAGDQRSSSTVIPIVLRHGDVVITLGKSRLAKHAVPAVLFNQALEDPQLRVYAQRASHRLCSNPACSVVEASEECLHPGCTFCKAFVDYVLTTRINMNVRQVLPLGHSFSDFEKT